MDIKRLQERLFECANKMRALIDKAEKEDRGLSADEREEWNAMRDDYDAVELRIADAEKKAALYDGADLTNTPDIRVLPGRGDTDGTTDVDPKAEAQQYARAFDAWARHGMDGLDTEHRQRGVARQPVDEVVEQAGTVEHIHAEQGFDSTDIRAVGVEQFLDRRFDDASFDRHGPGDRLRPGRDLRRREDRVSRPELGGIGARAGPADGREGDGRHGRRHDLFREAFGAHDHHFIA